MIQLDNGTPVEVVWGEHYEPKPVEDRKVISMFTREPYEGDGEGAPIPGSVPPDEISIQAAEQILEKLRAGLFVGLVALCWEPGANQFRWVTGLPPDEILGNSSVRYLGGLELVREQLLDFSDNENFARDVLVLEDNETE